MGQITIRELENMDFFKEIPKDILQNLLNESKVVSYKKKEVIFHSRSRTKTCLLYTSLAQVTEKE